MLGIGQHPLSLHCVRGPWGNLLVGNIQCLKEILTKSIFKMELSKLNKFNKEQLGVKFKEIVMYSTETLAKVY